MSGTNVAVYRNECHLAGELAKDPEIRRTTTGKTVANLTLLTKHQQFSEFHKVVLWEALAARVEKLRKGDFLRVVGRLATRSWDDKQTNQKRYTTEVVAYEVSIPSEASAPITPDSVKGGTAAARPILRPASQTNAHGVEATDADIPF